MKLFCVVVGAEGSAFSVDVDLSATVDDLKTAIRERRNIDALVDLPIFATNKNGGVWLSSKDADAIAMRTGAVPDRIKDLLLEEMDPTDVLGDVFTDISRKNLVHVLVVISKPLPAGVISQMGVFNHCEDAFFSQLPNAREVSIWLEFPSLLPLPEQSQLHIRPSYRVIADQIVYKKDPNRRKHALVTGTPGVGKSVFLYYGLW